MIDAHEKALGEDRSDQGFYTLSNSATLALETIKEGM